MENSVIRLRNPLALRDPTLKALFVRAFRNEHVHVDMDKAWPDIENMVTDGKFYGVFLGLENGLPKACCFVSLPRSLLFPYPQFMNLYSEGSHKTAEACGLAAVDFMKAAGYNKAWAMNASGREDPVWLRVWRKAGDWKLIGSLAECKLK